MNLYKKSKLTHCVLGHCSLYTMFRYAILQVSSAMLRLRYKPAFEIVAKIQSVDLISSTRLRTN